MTHEQKQASYAAERAHWAHLNLIPKAKGRRSENPLSALLSKASKSTLCQIITEAETELHRRHHKRITD